MYNFKFIFSIFAMYKCKLKIVTDMDTPLFVRH